MAFIPCPNVIQVEVRGLVDAQRVENVLYFLTDSPPVSPSDVELVAGVIDFWWRDSMIPCLPSAYVYRETYAMDLSSETGPTWTEAQAGPVPGTRPAPGGVLPNSATLAVSFRTAQRGRSHRGRNYVALLARNDVVGNEVVTNLQSALVSAYEELLPGGGMFSNFLWVVLSRYGNGAPRPQGLTTTITSVIIVDNIVDSQKRRLPARGN